MNSSLAASAPLNVVGCILHDELEHAGFSSPPTPGDVEFFRRIFAADLQGSTGPQRVLGHQLP